MKAKEIWKIIKEKYWILIVCIVIIFLGVLWFNSKIESTYEGNIGFSIIRLGKSEPSEFSDYYATQADNLITANFTKWLKSRSVTASIYERAEQDLDKKNLDQIVKQISVVKTSGTDISYSFEVTGKDEAQKIGKAVIGEVNARTKQIKKIAKRNENLRGLEQSSKLTIYQKSTNQKLNYLLGLIAGILLGGVVILFIRYFSPRKK